MGINDRTLNWLVNQAHELARGLDLYATALEEADDRARRDLLDTAIELEEVSSEIDISVETIERYILKALPGWQAARQNEQGEYCAPIHASDIAEGHGDKSEWRRVKFLMNNGAFSRITFYEVVSAEHARGRRWVRINKGES